MNARRKFASAAAIAVALCSLSGTSLADGLSTGFEDYNLGSLSGANGGYLSGDGRLAGGTDGPHHWWTPGNSVTDGAIVTTAAHSGIRSLALQRRNNNNDGVIVGIASPRLSEISGETAAPVNAPSSGYRFSYWFRTAPTAPPAAGDYRFGAEAWGPHNGGSDRYTWHRFIYDATTGGKLQFHSVGAVNDPSVGYFPDNDTIVATNLSWGVWYKVEVTISFVNGGDDNDVVTTKLYDASNVLLGTGIDFTWESYFRYSPEQVIHGPFGVDSINFVTRGCTSIPADPSMPVGDVAYIDDLAYDNLPPASVALTPVQACNNGAVEDVNLNVTASSIPFAGGQYFLAYDNTRLTYLGATTDPAFPTVVLNSSTAGTIDFANGIGFGGSPVSGPAHVATLHFARVVDTCASQGLSLVTFRSNTIPTRLTDASGGPIAAATTDLTPFTFDTTAPVFVFCAPNQSINADPGTGCTGTLNFTNTFDAPVPLCSTEGPGCWFPDRYPPAGFVSAPFLGGNSLKHSISSADSQANRPYPYSASTFYNTQGRKFDIDVPMGGTIGVDLYIPASWATSVRRADIWSTGFDNTKHVADYAIFGFINNDPADPLNPAPAHPTPRFRAYTDDQTPPSGNWTDLAVTVAYDSWHRFEITLTPTGLVYTLDHVQVATLPNAGTVRLHDVMLQGYNFGESYDIYWDNLNSGVPGPVVTDNCDVTVSYARQDNPTKTFADPFPEGTTLVTWTATDCAGNSSTCTQSVTVSPTTTFSPTVQLAGVSSGPFTRCITFDFFDSPNCPNPSATVDYVMNFTGGIGSATFEVPCGVYNCVTARDKRHTLRRTATGPNFAIGGGAYNANFTGTNALIGGNLNDDAYIDILDFGAFVGQYGHNYGSPNTDCTTAYPNADISGDGLVWTEDYTFIADNFLKFRDPDCCNNTLMAPPNSPGGPTTDISVYELAATGRADMAKADFNHDGRLNEADLVHAMQYGLPTHRADFNDDGRVTVQDIFDFLSAWFVRHPAADMNGDGVVSVQDVFTFLTAWFTDPR